MRAQSGYGQLPLSFEANQGQTDERVQFLARGDGYSLFLTRTESVLALLGPAEPGRSGSVLRMTLLGGNPTTPATGLDELPGKSHYFVGHDPQKWRTNIPTYLKVRFAGVYPGVDLEYYGNQRQLEYDFVVAPGADPSTIRLGFAGAERMEIDAQGELTLQTSGGEVRWRKPVVYQEVGGSRQMVDAHYVRKGTEAVGFAVAPFNPALPLVIDPVLVYSTYLGVSSDASAIAVDSSGSAYVTGGASSFPTTSGAFMPALVFARDAFVAKMNPGGTGLIYSTYLGGNGNNDVGTGIAVDSSGHAYVTGRTNSSTFPTTVNAYDASVGGAGDAFLTKLDPSGSALLYSTYLGGGSDERGQGVAADSTGYAYVTGFTQSTDFPTLNAPQTTLSGTRDAFVTKLDTHLSGAESLVYSTYLGGGLEENGFGNTNQFGAIAVDASGNVYVTGSSDSADFPTVNAFQNTLLGEFSLNFNAFVTKIDPDLSGPASLIFSTYLGTGGSEIGTGIAVDSSGSAFVTGMAWSVPTTAGAFQESSGGSTDAFVTKLTPDGTALVYSTYLGGTRQDLGFGIAVDPSGHAYVTGYEYSTNFPTVNAVQASHGGPVGGTDAFVTKLTPDGSDLVFSTYLGGSANDFGLGIAASASGAAYVAGTTNSTDFPLANPFQGSGGVPSSAFVSKIAEYTAPTAVDDGPYSTSKNSPLTVNGPGVLANDVNGGGGALTAIKFSDPAHGSVTLNADGSFTYTPSQDYSGPDSFTYTVNDGTSDSNVATVTITVTGVNNAPVAFDDVHVTPEDTPLTVGVLAGVHSNDTDAEGDQLHATEVTGPSHGTLSLADDGSFSYTPAANYFGPDSFTYVTRDAQLDSNVATVSITVTPVDDPSAYVYVNDEGNPNSVSFWALGTGASPTLQPIGGVDTGGSGLAVEGVNGWRTVIVVGTHLFAANPASNTVAGFAINPADGQLTSVPGSPFPTGGVAHPPPPTVGGVSLGATADGKFLLVTNSYSADVSVFSIDQISGALTSVAGSPFAPRWPMPGVKPPVYGVTVTPNGQFAIVRVGGALSVFSMDSTSGSLTEVPASPFRGGAVGFFAPGAVTINRDSDRLFFGSQATSATGGRRVNVLSIAADGTLAAIPGSPFGASFAQLFPNSVVALLSPDERHLFVTNQQEDTISVFEVSDGSVTTKGSLAEIPGSPFPTGASVVEEIDAGGTLDPPIYTSLPIHMTTDPTGSFLITSHKTALTVNRIGLDGGLTFVSKVTYVPDGTILHGATFFEGNIASFPTVTNVVKQSQTISFGPLPGRTLGDPPFTLSATASSGLPVTFAVQGACSIAGTTVTLVAVGSCEVTASQDGNGIFLGAPPVVQQFLISPPVVTAAPAITSADQATFRVGTNGSFIVTTTGTPTPALTHAPAVAGQIGLPLGVTFVDNGDGTATLSGTPLPYWSGVYSIQFAAANGVAPDAVQTFTLFVEDLPAFWTSNTATFRAGTASTFVVGAIGLPIPVVSLDSGALPAGISFDPAPFLAYYGSLQGTPTTPGVYPLTFKASNAVGDTFQSFTLTIVDAPAITVTPQSPTLDVGATQPFSASSGGRVLPNASVAQIVTGFAHSCALLTDGTVTCWGTPYGPAPTPVAGLGAVSQIAAGDLHTCALLTDLTVRCWGYNFYGQLGGATPPDLVTPTPVLDTTFTVLTNVQAIAAGGFFTCALLTDGTVRCWGGLPGSTTGLTDVTALAAGGRHACVLLVDGSVKCWGENTYGQLGDGTTSPFPPVQTPVTVVDGFGGTLSGVRSISASVHHTCAVMTDTTVKCWGGNRSGQLGDGTTTDSPVPVVVGDGSGSPLIGVAAVAAGGGAVSTLAFAHTCALSTDGTVRCWGANGYGQLGIGAPGFDVLMPTAVNGLSDATAITAGVGNHLCARLLDGSATCWGLNTSGQIGDGTTSGSPAPVATLPLGVTWTSSDPAVATIDTSGIVTAASEGTTVITAAYGSLSGNTTVSVIIPPNRPPTAGADTATTTEDAAPVAIPVLVNDNDPDGDALTIVNVSTPQHGSAATDGSTITYTPDSNYSGTDSFEYTISDGQGHTAIGTVLVSIAGVPDAPIARNDFYTLSQNSGAPSILANDLEFDGRTMTAVLVSPPANGSLALNANGTFTYTPASPVSGPDSFTYKVFDSLLESNIARVSVNNPCSINWKNAVSGLWSDAANWDVGHAPLPTDDVCIGVDGVYTVVLQGTQFAANVTIGSSSLGAGPTLRLEATGTEPAHLTLSGNLSNAGEVLLDSVGAQDVALTLTSGVLNNQRSGVVNVNAGAGGARTISGNLANQGTVQVATATTWTGGTLTNHNRVTLSERLTTNSATFTQQAGTLDVVGDWSLVGDRFVMNAGEFNFTGGTVSGTVSLRNSRLNSTPTIGSGRFFMSGASIVTGRILSGQQVIGLASTGGTILAVGAETNAGVLGLSSAAEDGNATLRIATSLLTNTGTILVEQGPRSGGRTLTGNIDNQMTVNITADTTFNGGSLTNQNRVTISGRLTLDLVTFNQNAGLLDLVGDWSTVGYRFVMTSGTFSFGGTFFNGGTVSGRLSLHDSILNSRPASGSGQFDLSGSSTVNGRILAGQQVMGVASSGGTILTAVGLTNAGLLGLSSVSENGDATLAIGVVLTNTGTLLVEQGPKTGARTIDGGPLVNQGSVNVTTDTMFESGEITNEGSVTLSGRLTMNGTTFNQNGGSLVIVNGTPGVFGTRFVMNAGTFNFTGGTISGSDIVVKLHDSTLNNDPTSASGEFWLSGASTLRGTILNGQRVDVTDSVTMTDGVTNAGLLILGSAAVAITSGALTNTGELVIFGGTTISGDLTNKKFFSVSRSTVSFDAGTFRNVAPGSISGGNVSTLAIGSAGVFFSSGFISVNVVNAGQFNPGQSPGSALIGGNYTQTGGVFVAEIGGSSPGTDYDVMTVSGTVTISPGATLQVSRLGGYCASSSARIINAGALIGDFGTKTVTPAGATLSTSIAAGGYDVTVDCRLPQTITFEPVPSKTFGNPPFTVAATASSGLPVSFTATGNCTNSGATITITGAGSCTITASQGGNATYQAAADVPQAVTIARARAVLLIANLSQIYNGTPRVVSWRTVPPDLTGVSVTYVGSPTPPINAGSYAVVATLNNPNYLAVSSTGTLVVDKASTSTTLTSSVNPSAVGGAVSFVAVVTAPGGGTPTGTVSFKDGGVEFGKPNPIGRKTLGPCPAPAAPNTACATYRISTLTRGKHSITADYFGDLNLTPSSSPAVAQQVK